MRINCLGEICPIPSLKVRSFITEMQPGEALEVVVDHSCAVGNIIEIIDVKTYGYEVEEVANGIWEVRINRL